MTDTPTVDEHEPGTGPDVPADQPIALSEAVGSGSHTPVKDRLVLPFLVPVLSAIAVGVLAVNVSRVFLAGGSTSALFVAIFVTLSILGGASLLAAAPHMRTSSLAMVTGLIVVIVMGAGLLTLGPSLGHEEAGATCVTPKAAATSTLEVVAGSGTTFSGVAFDTDYPAAPGVVEIDYVGQAGHTLAFREPNILCTELATPGPPNKENVELKAGETYDIYCTLPGHAASGMEATITVAAA